MGEGWRKSRFGDRQFELERIASQVCYMKAIMGQRIKYVDVGYMT